MESYGALLKEARLAKGLDFETISRETTIATRYLEALEEEATDRLPGEAYLVGFLRNYADYLGLDKEKLNGLYRAKTLQMSPVPEGLLIKHRPRWIVPTIVIVGVLFVGAAAFLSVFFYRRYMNDPARELAKRNQVENAQYELGDQPLARRVYKGDQLLLGTTHGNLVLTVAQASRGSLGIETPVGIQFIDLAEEREVDVDGDSVPEMIVYVSDVSTSETERGAEVRIMLKSDGGTAFATIKDSDILNAESLPQGQERTVIFEDNRAYPFTLNVTFRAGCLFRYRPDRKDTIEDYFGSGDVVTITASNMVRMWVSNGNLAKMQIIADGKTYDLAVSKAGEVIAEDIRWIKDTDGRYKVVVMSID